MDREKYLENTGGIVRMKMVELLDENERLRNWVNDLQAGMYINCVYCGHRYGPDTEIPTSMANVLKEHIEQCPNHPLFEAKQEIKKLRKEREWLIKGWSLDLYIKEEPYTLEEREKEIVEEMQQALKEKKCQSTKQ